MPSPFPGMDPYLEQPDQFPDLHSSLIFLLKQSLKSQLPAPYSASSDQRTWIDATQRFVEPDLNVFHPRHVRREEGNVSAGVAVAEADDSPIVVEVAECEWTENYLEIYHGRGRDRRLVTSMEVLSPSSKAPGNRGRKLYLEKQCEILDSQVHLVEIDLLRRGAHSTSIPLEYMQAKVPPCDYHVCIHRYDRPPEYLVYRILLERKLPRIRIPLLPDDGDVPVDLQEIFDLAYDAGPYDLQIDYAEDPPPPPFDKERLAWIRECIQAVNR